MNAFEIFLIVILMASSVGLIVFVLLHSGKGTGVSEMLGGVLPSTSTGTSIIEKNLDRITIGFAVAFFVCLVVLMIVR